MVHQIMYIIKLLGLGLRPIWMRVVTSFLTLHHVNYHSEIFALIAYLIFFSYSVLSIRRWYDLGSLTSTDKWVYLKNTHSLAVAFPGNLNFRKFFSSTQAWPPFLCLDCAPFEGQSRQSSQDCHFPSHYSDYFTRLWLGRVKKKGRSISKMESTSDDSEPSYAIVNKQLQDVIRFQHTVIARMKAKARNHWISFIS